MYFLVFVRGVTRDSPRAAHLLLEHPAILRGLILCLHASDEMNPVGNFGGMEYLDTESVSWLSDVLPLKR